MSFDYLFSKLHISSASYSINSGDKLSLVYSLEPFLRGGGGVQRKFNNGANVALNFLTVFLKFILHFSSHVDLNNNKELLNVKFLIFKLSTQDRHAIVLGLYSDISCFMKCLQDCYHDITQ